MQVVHERDGGVEVLATDVAVADSVLSRARGLMFRRSLPDGEALVFEFSGRARRGVHMVFVPFDIDVLWLVGGEVQRAETLSAWTGRASAEAERFVELPAGAASDVRVGDAVRIEP